MIYNSPAIQLLETQESSYQLTPPLPLKEIGHGGCHVGVTYIVADRMRSCRVFRSAFMIRLEPSLRTHVDPVVPSTHGTYSFKVDGKYIFITDDR